MTDADIIEMLYHKLEVTSGRHLYGVLGPSYKALRRFAQKLQAANMPDGHPFPAPLSVTSGILKTIPDSEFHTLVQEEARQPEPTRAHVRDAFERFLRGHLNRKEGLMVLERLELLFVYNVDLSLLRTLATDAYRILLLLPGRRESGYVRLFPGDQPEQIGYAYRLPKQIIADQHLWELQD